MLHIHYLNHGTTLRVSDEASNQTIYIPAGGEQALLDRVWRILVRYDVRHPSPLPEPPPFNPHGFAGSWEPQSPGDVGLPVAVEETPATAEGKTLAECRDFLRSVAAIADRDGAQTNWAAVRARVAELLQAVDGGIQARDYPEDASHENGNYQNICCHCDQPFIGHKRRVSCRKCRDEGEAAWNALTDDERAAAIEKQKQAIKDYMQNRPKPEGR